MYKALFVQHLDTNMTKFNQNKDEIKNENTVKDMALLAQRMANINQ